MNCKNCSVLRWHPNKGFYCTVPNCKPETKPEDVKEIYKRAGILQEYNKQKNWR